MYTVEPLLYKHFWVFHTGGSRHSQGKSITHSMVSESNKGSDHYYFGILNLIPRPNLLEKGPGIHCLRMCIIIYAKTEGEGHMIFPIHVR